MKLEMTGQMRMEQRMKLAPHMIQSMEILQLPLLALQERIEQELNSNPVLELDDDSDPDETQTSQESAQDDDLSEKALVVDAENRAEDLERLGNLGDEFKDLIDQSGPYHSRQNDDEKDLKQEAIKNTAAPPQSLHDYLMEQWRLVDADEPVKKAGGAIIDYIDDRGYLSVPLEQLHTKDQTAFTPEHLSSCAALFPPGRLKSADVPPLPRSACPRRQRASACSYAGCESRYLAGSCHARP